MELLELQKHLLENAHKFEITEIYDRSGYSPLHFAAYKNSEKMVELICDYVNYSRVFILIRF